MFGPGVEVQPVSAVGGEEQHVFELDVTPEHDRGLPVVASVTSLSTLSGLEVEWHFFGSAIAWSFTGDSSVFRVTQHEGNPILSISVQRQSVRSRAAFHCARECCIPLQGVDRASCPGLLAVCVIEACVMALRQFSAYHQWQVFD